MSGWREPPRGPEGGEREVVMPFKVYQDPGPVLGVYLEHKSRCWESQSPQSLLSLSLHSDLE